jgi:hypothetical protein
MITRIGFGLFAVTTLAAFLLWSTAPACCPAPPSGKPVVNADQTVLIIWDAANKMQHFIRQASFKGEADDFGFIVPSPTQPELEESGNDAFPHLRKLTEPEVIKIKRPAPGGCGCSSPSAQMTKSVEEGAAVRVLSEKQVAGFDAVVLEAGAADALVAWLKDHGYAFSPEVEAWAKPYVEARWKFTALKVAKPKDGKKQDTVDASALRMSFKTERPLFPYREPDPQSAAAALGARQRLLRIYLLAEARYRGELTPEQRWTGNVAWADKLAAADRLKLLEQLKLPATTGPQDWWLTEFEDNWPYRAAPADVTFLRDPDQSTVKRPPIMQYVSLPLPVDATTYALAAALVLPPLWRRMRRGATSRSTS